MARPPLIVACVTPHPEFVSTIAESLHAVFPVVEVRRWDAGKRVENGHRPGLLVLDAAHGGTERAERLPPLAGVPTVIVSERRPASSRRANGSDGVEWCRPRDAAGPLFAQLARHLLERHRLLAALHEAKAHLQERSVRDDLTGAFNKRHFLDLLMQAEKKVHRHKEETSILLVDCDHFKEFNHAKGLTAGDQVLSQMAILLQQTVRDIDAVARLDADEFAILLPDSGTTDALKVGERIRQAVEHYRSAVDGSAPIPTVSVGVATLGASTRAADETLEAARQGLALAKQRGRNQVASGEAVPAQERLQIDRQAFDQLKHDVATFTQQMRGEFFDGVHRVFTCLGNYKRLCQSHAERVAFYAERLASKLGLAEEEQATVRRGALLHDIGLAVMNEHLLTRTERLGATERAMLREHPLLGVQLVETGPFLRQELAIILHHHERIDGTGYPDRLAGSHIPLYARIVAITEAWDRMVEAQPYRAAMPIDRALTELRAHAGTQFDPEIVRVFCSMVAG
ncbi:MAG: diguanylate cyclase [Deltaproteobacteria bacterium]|nr:diguanylate cyclase [Deltaproteobacteria bacterium]